MMTRNLAFLVFLIQRLYVKKRNKLLQTREQTLFNLHSYLQYFRVNIPHTELTASHVYYYSEYAWFESRVVY